MKQKPYWANPNFELMTSWTALSTQRKPTLFTVVKAALEHQVKPR